MTVLLIVALLAAGTALSMAYPILLLPAASGLGAPNVKRKHKIIIWSYIAFISVLPIACFIWAIYLIVNF